MIRKNEKAGPEKYIYVTATYKKIGMKHQLLESSAVRVIPQYSGIIMGKTLKSFFRYFFSPPFYFICRKHNHFAMKVQATKTPFHGNKMLI